MLCSPDEERAAADDQTTAPDTVVAPSDACWLGGVSRQAMPDAPEHQLAASRAAAAKRTAEAASDEERRAKRKAADQARYDFRDVGDAEWAAFLCWLDGTELSREALDDWRNDPAYETWGIDQLAEEWVRDEAACAAEQARMEQDDARRRSELELGAPHEWAWRDDDFGWRLLSRDELAGSRRFYERLRPFAGSADEAELHLAALAEMDGEEEEEEACGELTASGGGGGGDGGDGGSSTQLAADDAWLHEQRERVRLAAQARVWLNEQHRLRDEQAGRELRIISLHGPPNWEPGGPRWNTLVGSACVYVTSRADWVRGVARQVVHYLPPEFHAGHSGALDGGCALGGPIVRGGVHEFAFTVDTVLPSDSEYGYRGYSLLVGLRGERRSGPNSTQPWTCGLCLFSGTLQYDDFSPSNMIDPSILKSGLPTPVPAGSTVVVRIHFDEQSVGFSVDGSPLKWFGPDVLAYVGCGFQPVSAQPYIEFGKLFSTDIYLPLAQAAKVSLTGHACLVAAPDVIAPTPPPGPRVIMAIDPVGDVPYFYLQDDTARNLARNWGTLDPTADSCAWHASTSAGSSSSRSTSRDKGPPRRGQYPLGSAGRRRFRDDRDLWYFERTGKHLHEHGSAREQGEAFDLLARNYRARRGR